MINARPSGVIRPRRRRGEWHGGGEFNFVPFYCTELELNVYESAYQVGERIRAEGKSTKKTERGATSLREEVLSQ